MTALAWIVAGIGVVAVRMRRQWRKASVFLAELPPAEPEPEVESDRDVTVFADWLAERGMPHWRAEGRRLIGRDQ